MSDNLPANPMAKFAQKAAEKRSPSTRIEGGFLNFNGKTGDWTFGQDETEVDQAEVLVASHTLQHGWVRWGEKPPAKVFTSIQDDMPEPPEPMDGKDFQGNPTTFHAERAYQFGGKFLGDDDDLGQFIFNTHSMGGTEAVEKLRDAILLKAMESPYCYPVVVLENTYYNKPHGKVYKPVFRLVHWCDQDGDVESDAKRLEAQDEPEGGDEPPPDEKPSRKRRRRAA